MPLVERSERHMRWAWICFAGGTLVLAALSRLPAEPTQAPPGQAATLAHDHATAGLRLRDGHFLTVQQYPPLVVELGPPGAAAGGAATETDVVARSEELSGVPLK